MKRPTKQKPKRKTGRKTKFDEKMVAEVEALTEKGLTDKEISERYNVTVRTVHNWKKKYPEFFHSLKKGKEIADNNVIKSLYHRAMGYSHPEIIVSNYRGEITKTLVVKHYPPDPTSMIFWLCNRKPEDWKSVNKERTQENPNTPVTVDFKFRVVNDDK